MISAFTSRIEPVETPTKYVLSAVLVAIIMVLLPLVYVALVCLIGYGVAWHATNNVEMLSLGRGRGGIFVFLLYISPIIAGGLGVLFMIKPLFARSGREGRLRSLRRDREPVLFAFVDRICEAVGSPAPSRIDVDADMNASASFRRGWLSFLGDDLVLTLGMPLVAGLSTRQLAGVLAHEFGHFSQGAGMRLTYVIRTTAAWFARVVYERDVWDERLVIWSQSEGWLTLFLMLTRFLIWLTRWVLWGLMYIGFGVGHFLLRQMEFDADRHSSRLIGSGATVESLRRVATLGFGHEMAMEELQQFHREGRLGDNLPKLTLANALDIERKSAKELDEMLAACKTGLFDTHPAFLDRVTSILDEPEEGVFRVETSAAILFSHYEATCRNVTIDFYHAVLGKTFDTAQLHSTDDLLVRRTVEIEASEALNRFLLKTFSPLRPLRLPSSMPAPADDYQQTGQRLQYARKVMEETRPAHEDALKSWDECDTRVVRIHQASIAIRANMRVTPKEFFIDRSNARSAANAGAAAAEELANWTAHLDAFESAASHRIVAALAMIQLQAVADRIPGSRVAIDQARKLLPILAKITNYHQELLALRNDHAGLALLGAAFESNREDEKFIREFLNLAKRVRGRLVDLKRQFATTPYPFDHAKAHVTLSEYLLEEIPAEDEVGQIYEAVEGVSEAIPRIYVRLASRIIATSEKVEEILGLPPLTMPAEEPSGDGKEKTT